MNLELAFLRHLVHTLRARWQHSRAEPEAGYTTETVIVTALLIAMAITVVAIIAAKVLAKAHSITTG